MKKFLGLALLAGALGTGNVWAATVTCTGTEFMLAGLFADSATLGGTLDINTTNGTVCSGSVEIVNPTGNADITVLESGGAYASGTEVWNGIDFQQNDPQNDKFYTIFLDLDLSQQTNTNSLVGYSGGNLCFATLDPTAGNCSNGSNGYIVSTYSESGDPDLTSGTLSDSPEPASFFMLAGPAMWFGLRRLRRAR